VSVFHRHLRLGQGQQPQPQQQQQRRQQQQEQGQDQETAEKASPLQVSRANIHGRLVFERAIQKQSFAMLHFLAMLLCFLLTLSVYDPLAMMGEVHDNLRVLYKIDTVKEYRTPDEIMKYMQSFIETTYEMASALIDANTMNTIDPTRCFSTSVSDICRLKYWETPIRLNASSYFVDIKALLRDDLSIINKVPSHMDCSQQPAVENCLDWDKHVNPNLTTNLRGLTGEDPIIMKSRRQYPFASVVVLAPMVWQVRAPVVPCSGFGDKYNLEVLGAGKCSSDIKCDPGHESSFRATKPSPVSGRTQSIFIAYIEDAFYCVDRALHASEWRDKSWDPWASYDDLTVGRAQTAAEMGGKKVFWKFISDTAYLRGPVKGLVVLDKNDPCSTCDAWGPLEAPRCTDPVEDGTSHPMWTENDMDNDCSSRRVWTDRFMASEKEHTFFDIGTSEITIAALVITPQGEKYPDITTLVRVTFKVSQSGAYMAEPILSSTSQTKMNLWIPPVVITLVLASTFIFGAIHRYVKNPGRISVMLFDVLASGAVLSYLIWNLVLEFGPPHIVETLVAAFNKNDQDSYFDCFRNILQYSDSITVMKTAGFYLIILLFFRLVHMLSVHPQLGLIVAVIAQCLDDIFYFCIQFILFFLVLSFLGHWSFGGQKTAFMTLGRSSYTLFRFITQDFSFSDEPPSATYWVFLFLYVSVVGIMMMSFLLAIVVNAHTVVTDTLKANEKTWCTETWCTSFRGLSTKLSHGWPMPGSVCTHIEESAVPDQPMTVLPAVTAEELCRFTTGTGSKGRPLFASLQSAQAYLEDYVKKTSPAMEETRASFCFNPGHYYGEDLLAPLGEERCARAPEAPSSSFEALFL
ncbi:unnamed protein product, partial [Polarella glacialis]